MSIIDIKWRLAEVEESLSVQRVRHGTLLRMLRSLHERIQYENTIGVLVMACNRPNNLDRTLSQIIRYTSSPEYRPPDIRLSVVVSQDCGDAKTAELIQSYSKYNITRIEQPDQSDMGPKLDAKDRRFLGYYNIARHYKFALSHVFNKLHFSAVIIVEDDLDISPDFFEYFSATLPLLRADPTLWCVSAWNDNGKTELVSDDADMLYRTDFFPGLGWMLLRETWLELEPKWPSVFWDDWMRMPEQRRNRACIRPEIPRSSTFGREGTSKGQFYDLHLKFIKHCDRFVQFSQQNLSYLYKSNFDEEFLRKVYSQQSVHVQDVILQRLPPELHAVRIEYNSVENLKQFTSALGLMDDIKSGVPRMAYKGIISMFLNGRRIYLTPPLNWSGYDVSWT